MSRGARAANFRGGFRAVFERDFLVLTSGGQFVLLRTLVLAFLAGLAILILLGTTTFDGSSRDLGDRLGRALFGGIAVTYPFAVALVAPALASGSIAGERVLDTLPLVLAAPVRPFALVLAKYVSRLGALLVPLGGGLPIAATCFLYGGISAGLFLQWMAFVLALAAMAVAASVLASAYARTVSGAVLGAYFVGVGLPILETVGAGWLWHDALRGDLPDWVWEHTVGSAFSGIAQSAFGVGGSASITPFLVSAALGVTACLALATARLSRESATAAAGGPRSRKARRPVFANPVLDRATLALPIVRGGWRTWIALVVCGALTWLPMLDEFEDDEIIVGLNIGTWVTAIVLLARASQSLAAERQQGSLALLLATPLRAQEIVRGKLGGVATEAVLLLSPALALGLIGVAAGELSPACVVTWSFSTGAVLFLFSAAALRVSSRASTAGRAAGLAFAVTLGGVAVHGLLLFALAVMGIHDEDSIRPVAAASPPFAVGFLTNAPDGGRLSGDERAWVGWCTFWCLTYVVGGLVLTRSAGRSLESMDA